MSRVENEVKVVGGLNGGVNVAKSESGIGVHGVGVEGEWNAVGIRIDVDVVGPQFDVVDPEVEVWWM